MKIRKNITINEDINNKINLYSALKKLNYSKSVEDIIESKIDINFIDEKIDKLENMINQNKRLLLNIYQLEKQFYADMQIENMQDIKKSESLSKAIKYNKIES